MIPECFGIIIIVGLLTIDLLRRGRKAYAISTLPLLIVPVLHLSAYFVGTHTRLNDNLTVIISDIAALLITVFFLFVRMRSYKSRKNKVLYFVGCSVYSALVALRVIITSF